MIADGNSPDVFAVPSDGGALLESKIEPIPDQYVSTEEFSRNFNRVFDGLILEKQEKDKEGKDITVSYLKGVPLGYETMAAYYNLDLVSNAVPRTWEELGKQAGELSGTDTGGGSETDEGGGEGGSASPAGTALAGLGLGSRYVQGAGDLAALFLVQNGVSGYEGLADNGSTKALADYLAFGAPTIGNTPGVVPNGNSLSSFRAEMDKVNLTATDLFARGKIGVVFGFPSFLREIQYSVKRASQENVLNKRNLKTTAIPVANADKQTNLARYNYFALSKYAKDQMGGLDFIIHLTKKESHESYLEKFPYVLPALNELVDKRKEKTISSDFPRVKYESFLPAQGVKAVAFDKGMANEFDGYFRTALDSGKDPKQILTDLSSVVKCQRRHLVEGSNFEEACPSF